MNTLSRSLSSFKSSGSSICSIPGNTTVFAAGWALCPHPHGRGDPQLFQIQLKAAAQTNGLDTILDGYRAAPDRAPSAEILRKTATDLLQAGDKQSARKILEFVFTREIENRNLTAREHAWPG